MNKTERIKMVKAMEYIARQINDEEILLDHWLVGGVADGDIKYGDLESNLGTWPRSDDGSLDYIDDDTFRDLMDEFLHCMKMAWRVGGLYCDGIVTKRG